MRPVWKSTTFLVLSVGFTVTSTENNYCHEYVATNCVCMSSMYDCSYAGLDRMLNKTEEDTRTLDMSGNDIQWTMVLDAPSLVYLSLAHNKITTLKYDTFINLGELNTLVLSNNSLSRINDEIFESNPLKLQVLKLDGNKIEFVQQFLFYDLEQLTELDMHNNKIGFIHPRSFLHLKKLTKLRLDGNHLHTLESRWFDDLRANMFTLINMSANPWACDCTMKQLMPWLLSTEQEWLSNAMPSELECVLPEDLVGTPVTKTVSLKGLECQDPDITEIAHSLVLFEHQTVELGCTVEHDRLPVASIMWIAPNKNHYNFQTSDRFDGINVFQNGSIIIRDVKIGDGGEYTCVAINNVSSVQASTKLNVLARPESETMNRFAVADLTTTHGKVIAMDTSCPEKCFCVSKHVHCTSNNPKNGIKEIDYDQFPSDAVSIDLSLNSITRIPQTSESLFTMLLELHFDKNHISHIEHHAFDNLKQLETLTMKDNKISALPGKLFRYLTRLNILVLDNNLLFTIEDDTFFGLTSLRWLYIQNNLISSVSSNAFQSIPFVTFIHMEHNQLSTLSTETVKALTEPKGKVGASRKILILVDHNQFKCDCHLQDLKDYLKANPMWDDLFGVGIKCTLPSDLSGQYLKDIEEHLVCNLTTCDECKKETVQKNADPGTLAGLWFGGLLVGILCTVAVVLWRKRNNGMGINYRDLPVEDVIRD